MWNGLASRALPLLHASRGGKDRLYQPQLLKTLPKWDLGVMHSCKKKECLSADSHKSPSKHWINCMGKPRRREAANTIKLLRSAATQIMSSLGVGHTERVYHRAMITLLNMKGTPHRSEVLAPIYFLGEVVGFGRCDLVIKNLVVELKANTRCPTSFSPQLRKYMTSMGATEHKRFQGIIVNFNQRSGVVEIHKDRPQGKRKTPNKKKGVGKQKKSS